MQWTEQLKKTATALVPELTKPKRVALKDRQFASVTDEDIDFEFGSPNKFFGTHVNMIPLQSAVSGPRLFYGARFYNQALPLLTPETPWVQNKVDTDDPNEEPRSFDTMMGSFAGAVKSKIGGTVSRITPDEIEVIGEDGKPQSYPIYNHFSFNRKTQIHNTPLVNPGDTVTPGQVMAKSNYTDDSGGLALGLNARIGLVPYKGYSMDDAVVVSESFAKRLTSNQLYGHDVDFKNGVQGGMHRYVSLFPKRFINDQLKKVDKDGVIKSGQTVEYGDPIILATKPKVISSTSAQLGKLSKHMRNAQQDAAVIWEHETPGRVLDVEKLKNGVRVNIETDAPARPGDKLVLRTGQKGVISQIIPDEQMPRTTEGSPLEVLLNPLGLPSRMNDSLLFELLLGKAAAKTGNRYVLPSFNTPQEKWYEMVEQELQKAGVTDLEDVFDPVLNRKLQNPITVGVGHILKLYHTGESKASVRGQGAYTQDQIPLHGGSDAGKAKRLSGLELHGLQSAGAYNFIREGATLRGQRNDEYWRTLRMGYEPRRPGTPFVWDKFRALLAGSGYQTRKVGDGKMRLQMWSDKDLANRGAIEVKSGDLVNLASLEPIKGGLFDPALTGSDSWGYVQLPEPYPNPAAEDIIRKLLGLTEKQFIAIMSGQEELPAHLR